MFEVFTGMDNAEVLAVLKSRIERVFPNLTPEQQANLTMQAFDMQMRAETTMMIQSYKQSNIKEMHK